VKTKRKQRLTDKTVSKFIDLLQSKGIPARRIERFADRVSYCCGNPVDSEETKQGELPSWDTAFRK